MLSISTFIPSPLDSEGSHLTQSVLHRSSAADQKTTIAVRLYAMGHPRDHWYAILETMTKPKPRGSHLQQMWNSVWIYPNMNLAPWIELPISALETHWKVISLFSLILFFLLVYNLFLKILGLHIFCIDSFVSCVTLCFAYTRIDSKPCQLRTSHHIPSVWWYKSNLCILPTMEKSGDNRQFSTKETALVSN